MAANQFGVDFGDALKTATEVNALNTKQNINSLRSQFAQNPDDETLRKQLLIMDPEGMNKTAEAISKMDENQRKTAQGTALRFAHIGALVQESDNPQATWDEIKASSPEEIQQAMGDYSPLKTKQMYYNGMTVDQLFKNPEVATYGGNDYVFKNGRQVGKPTPSGKMIEMTNSNQQKDLDRQNKKDLKIMDDTSSGKANAAAITELRHQAENAVGGVETIDPETGKKNIDSRRASQANWVAARAEVYVTQGRPVAQAINQAKRDMDSELAKEVKASKSGGARPSAKGLF